ncbi:hypothetical protein HK105_208664 [Polyrhizophydium stewartii]|uniref:Uncharacterized protein n=1 Tax=Polyrhizophydium stewartii TaxID=2732419 RepID=A0ABR4MXD9_9FUNG
MLATRFGSIPTTGVFVPIPSTSSSTESATPAPPIYDPAVSRSSGLSVGGVVGIAIGFVGASALALAVLVLFIRARRRRGYASEQTLNDLLRDTSLPPPKSSGSVLSPGSPTQSSLTGSLPHSPRSPADGMSGVIVMQPVGPAATFASNVAAANAFSQMAAYVVHDDYYRSLGHDPNAQAYAAFAPVQPQQVDGVGFASSVPGQPAPAPAPHTTQFADMYASDQMYSPDIYSSFPVFPGATHVGYTYMAAPDGSTMAIPVVSSDGSALNAGAVESAVNQYYASAGAMGYAAPFAVAQAQGGAGEQQQQRQQQQQQQQAGPPQPDIYQMYADNAYESADTSDAVVEAMRPREIVSASAAPRAAPTTPVAPTADPAPAASASASFVAAAAAPSAIPGSPRAGSRTSAAFVQASGMTPVAATDPLQMLQTAAGAPMQSRIASGSAFTLSALSATPPPAESLPVGSPSPSLSAPRADPAPASSQARGSGLAAGPLFPPDEFDDGGADNSDPDADDDFLNLDPEVDPAAHESSPFMEPKAVTAGAMRGVTRPRAMAVDISSMRTLRSTHSGPATSDVAAGSALPPPPSGKIGALAPPTAVAAAAQLSRDSLRASNDFAQRSISANSPTLSFAPSQRVPSTSRVDRIGADEAQTRPGSSGGQSGSGSGNVSGQTAGAGGRGSVEQAVPLLFTSHTMSYSDASDKRDSLPRPAATAITLGRDDYAGGRAVWGVAAAPIAHAARPFHPAPGTQAQPYEMSREQEQQQQQQQVYYHQQPAQYYQYQPMPGYQPAPLMPPMSQTPPSQQQQQPPQQQQFAHSYHQPPQHSIPQQQQQQHHQEQQHQQYSDDDYAY